ncbi:hypothetical protein RJG79_01430 [Mycoplasmatota bacterium WC44]
MLTIKCSKCKSKLFKYNKIGMGSVLKCHFQRIDKWIVKEPTGDLFCECGNKIAIRKDTNYKMIPKSFKYTGRKDN